MVQGIDNCEEIDGNIDRAGEPRYFRRGHPASRVNAVRDDEQRAMTAGAPGHGRCRRGDRIVERREAPWLACEAHASDVVEILGEADDFLQPRIKGKEGRFVLAGAEGAHRYCDGVPRTLYVPAEDRKSTRLNSSH